MKVVIREANGRSFKIVIPTGLALNRLTASVIPRVLEKKGVVMTREQLLRLIQAIRACRRRCPGWKLAEIESSDGDYVEISL